MRRSDDFSLRKSLGRAAWELSSDHVRAWVTRAAGHLGPVAFRVGKKWIEPLAIAPWMGEKQARQLPPLLRGMGGDFFCMPFGGNAKPYRKEVHPCHGETAQDVWKLDRHVGVTFAEWSLNPKVRPGRVVKKIWLIPGETMVYQRHEIHGMTGPMNLGHHAIVQFPDEEGSGRISTSGFSFGQVYPGEFEDPAQGGYSSLKRASYFSTLESVRLAIGGKTDLSRYPARRGYTDLVMLISKLTQPFAWTAVTFPRERYVWFSLKDPRVLRQTVLWISNGGRHYYPWNGRHVSAMGIEEVTSYFHEGLAESAAPNPINRRGVPTCLSLKSDQPTQVNYIMGAVEIPVNFDEVKTIEPCGGGILLTSSNGKKVSTKVNFEFLAGKSPA
jgi:hypothetical protein